MSSEVSTEVVTPSNLSFLDIESIYELEQDMWARKEGLGEYVQCKDCDNIYSKQDIYDIQNKEKYNLTVAEIERKDGLGIPNCHECGGEMFHRFERKRCIDEIQERYSHQAHLALMMREGVILGFMDGYLGSFEKIYNQELADHYGKIGQTKISVHISNILGEPIPDELFTCCSMGTRQDLMNMKNIYSILQCFFLYFPNEYEGKLGIAELHKGGTLDKLYRSLGSKDIGMSAYKEDISCSDIYDSGLFIQENLGKKYKEGFAKDLRTFLRERAI